MLVAPEILDLVPDAGAAGMPDHEARAQLFVEAAEVHVLQKDAVVSSLGFLEVVQVFVELFLGREGHAVDTLQHRTMLVAAPVGAGHGEKLHGLHGARRFKVRSAAEV